EFRDQAGAPPAISAAPVPQPRPEAETAPPLSVIDPAAAPPPAPGPPPSEPPPPADPRSAVRSQPSGTLPAEESACRRRLAALGANFEARASLLEEEIGC